MKFKRMTLARAAIVVIWLGFVAWLLRYEAYPSLFTHTIEGYRDVLAEGQLFVDSWHKILFQGDPIGASHTSVETKDNNATEHFRLSNRTQLNLNLMGQRQAVSINSSADLDLLYRLQRFEFSLAARRYNMRIEGRRLTGTKFIVTIYSDAGPSVSRVDIPDDVILYSPMTEMTMARMKSGDVLHMKTFDPASLTAGDVVVTALRREKLKLSSGERDALALSVAYQGVNVPTWIDEEGRLLRQDSTLGWMMEACTMQEAMSLKFDGGRSADMLAASAVPLRGVIADQFSAQSVRLRLEGLSAPALQIESPRQEIQFATNDMVEVVLTPASWPEGGEVEKAEAFLEATPFIQSTNPDMLKRARAVTKDAKDERAKALAIYDWVYRNVKKVPTVSLPSALDVLQQMEGDCNEHTYLFVALARAAGLPAKVRVGLLYKDGAFYYHAWPSVFVGGWMEMDPTVGEPLVDAAHVGLLDGELADQLKLFSLFGRLKAEVLAQDYGTDHS